uniref:Uncharacterized protein n=1 Tax=Meloidogyne floridensis TaxID=298350 RepID=A0A915P1K3_9BILA
MDNTTSANNSTEISENRITDIKNKLEDIISDAKRQINFKMSAKQQNNMDEVILKHKQIRMNIGTMM